MIGNFTHSKHWAIFGSVAVHMFAMAAALWTIDQASLTASSAGTISVRLTSVQSESEEEAGKNNPSSLTSDLSEAMPAHKRVNPHLKAPLLLATSSARQIKAIVIEQAQTTKPKLKAKPTPIPVKVVVNPKPVKTQTQPRTKSLLLSSAKPVVRAEIKVPNEDLKQPSVRAIKQKAQAVAKSSTKPSTKPSAMGILSSTPSRSTTPNVATSAQGLGSTDSGRSIYFDAASIIIKKMTPPKYPYYAILQRKSGTTVVAIELDAKGAVKKSNLHLSSEHKILDKAVLHAARKWQFVPPVPVGRVLVPVKFELECVTNGCKPKQVEQG